MAKQYVLLVGNFLSSRLGTQGVCETLADQLKEHHYMVFTTSNAVNTLQRLIDMVLKTWLLRHQFDVALIDTYNYRAFIWAEAVCWTLRRIGKPYILTLHAGLMPEFAREQPRRVERLLTSASAVTTPSNYLQNSLSHIRSDIILLPNAIEISNYQFRKRVAVQPRLVWLRAFEELYQPQLAIRVLHKVRQRYPQASLVLYGRDTGDGSLEACQRLIEEFGLKDAVDLPGKVPKKDVPIVLAPHDIFLNTTRAESFGVAVVEAAALGQCIVTTNVGELPYIWNHEETAMLVPPDDLDAMANAVLQVLENPSLAERLSTSARTKAEQFDWSIILPLWMNLIEDVVNKHKSKAMK